MTKEATAMTGQKNEQTAPIGHNNPPEAINEAGKTVLEQNDKINASTPSEGVLTKLETAKAETVEAAKGLISYQKKGETVLTKLALACMHLIGAKAEEDKTDISAWKRTNVTTMKSWVRSFLSDELKGKELDTVPGQKPLSNGTFDAYVGEAVELACMALCGRNGVSYHEEWGHFTVPSNKLYKTVFAPDPSNPNKQVTVENTSEQLLKIIRSQIRPLFYGIGKGLKIVNGETIREYTVEPGFPPEDGDVLPEKGVQKPTSGKGRKPKKAGTVTAEQSENVGHTATPEPITLTLSASDGSKAVDVALKPARGTTKEQMERAKALHKEPVMSLAVALGSLLNARMAVKTLGELSEADRNALNELAQVLEKVEDEWSKIDKANEAKTRKVA